MFLTDASNNLLACFTSSTMLAKSLTSILALCLVHNVQVILGGDDDCVGGFSTDTDISCHAAALTCGVR